MYYVYVLINKKNKGVYVGYTNNLVRRFKQHKRKFPQDKLIYYEAFLNEQNAREREKKLKYHSSAWRALRKRISI